ncbi:hypothetical protein NDU88_003385 [Pleurodeles waltl]|uniref:Uncharacterized protein n=1 Tax=Pleurodeles waltl TaxID=8319 RepID=A0AAV7TP15_PLEWA|nr:hypothetical protein NDU88_003385 [Pleurodeles waltl]
MEVLILLDCLRKAKRYDSDPSARKGNDAGWAHRGTSEGVTSVHISKRTDVGEGEKRMNEEQWEREDTNWKEDGTVKEEASANEKTK